MFALMCRVFQFFNFKFTLAVIVKIDFSEKVRIPLWDKFLFLQKIDFTRTNSKIVKSRYKIHKRYFKLLLL
eukprot:TRINITY_DN1439_c0_g1_i1.p1 TRINITY_DN1439_c0_g1~~TRINITY_DN1439_c0_g1_i1.p1  ORF type:complete len:71 (-),score=0.95 TRINITY_DN1439_c0_g1_i1:33-245(-)